MPSMLRVSAADSSGSSDASTIEATTGVANVSYTFVDSGDNPLVGASNVALASTGSNNTITPVSTVTDATGTFQWTFSSTTAEAKTLTASAGGLNVTQTTAITVSGSSPALTPEFFSDWAGVATGSSTASKSDDGKWTTVGGSSGTGVEVVAVSGLDMPAGMTQCLLVPWDNGVFNFLRVAGLSVPAVGESRAYRWYQRLVLPDGTSDTNQHPNQDGSAIGQANWAWNVYNDTTAGQFRTGVQFVGESFPNNNFYGPNLDKDATYRIEMLLTRDGSDATAFKFDVRIYDSSNVLVADAGDFVNSSAVSLETYCASNDLTFNNAANLDGFNAGCNDTGSEPGDWGYQGGVAICDNQGFIGAYGSVTGEA